jgi:hypothetical protein
MNKGFLILSLMYTREQASQLRKEFWTTFGQYLSPVLSSEGTRVNWLNYKTGVKDVFFRMDSDKREARIAIELSHPDAGIQELFFEQFEEYKTLLHDALGEEWHWDLHTRDESGKIISRIHQTLAGVSVFRKDDWPALISFFKPRIVGLDAFWSDVKVGFDALK